MIITGFVLFFRVLCVLAWSLLNTVTQFLFIQINSLFQSQFYPVFLFQMSLFLSCVSYHPSYPQLPFFSNQTATVKLLRRFPKFVLLEYGIYRVPTQLWPHDSNFQAILLKLEFCITKFVPHLLNTFFFHVFGFFFSSGHKLELSEKRESELEKIHL